MEDWTRMNSFNIQNKKVEFNIDRTRTIFFSSLIKNDFFETMMKSENFYVDGNLVQPKYDEELKK